MAVEAAAAAGGVVRTMAVAFDIGAGSTFAAALNASHTEAVHVHRSAANVLKLVSSIEVFDNSAWEDTVGGPSPLALPYSRLVLQISLLIVHKPAHQLMLVVRQGLPPQAQRGKTHDE